MRRRDKKQNLQEAANRLEEKWLEEQQPNNPWKSALDDFNDSHLPGDSRHAGHSGEKWHNRAEAEDSKKRITQFANDLLSYVEVINIDDTNQMEDVIIVDEQLDEVRMEIEDYLERWVRK